MNLMDPPIPILHHHLCSTMVRPISTSFISSSIVDTASELTKTSTEGLLAERAVSVISLTVSTFSLLLDTAPLDGKPASPLLRATANHFRLRLTNHSRSIEAGGDWLHLVSCLASVSVEDLTSGGRGLYSHRFLTTTTGAGSSGGDYLVFTLTKHQLPDPDVTRRQEDGTLELQLGPAHYVHTQEFLITVIDTLDRFLQYQDLMTRVRASTEGYKVRQGAPISMRLRLNVKAEAPIVILPVSAASEAVLVCNLGTLTAVNDFCWHTEAEGSRQTQGEEQEEEEEACKHCTSGLWWW